jgi:hypothetical protein
MKKDILKIAGVKSEKEFYKKFPTKKAFMKVHGKDFKKAAMGASMVKKQLTQLTDFANPPEAQMGAYIGGEQVGFKPVDFNSIYSNLDSTVGLSDQAAAMQDKIAAQKEEQQKGSGGGGIDPSQMAKVAGMFGGAKNGKGIPKYQNSGRPLKNQPPMWQQYAPQTATLDPMTGMVSSTTGSVSKQQTSQLDPKGKVIGMGGTNNNSATPKSLAQTSGGLLLDKAVSMTGPFAQPLGKAINAGRKVKQSIQQAAQARQSYGLASLANQASSTRPEQTKRRYVRPEDNLVNPGDVAPGFGTGTNFLAKDGMQIGGNLTEIQNMYNPGDIYMDLGYEPLSDSEKVKQYRKGGGIPKALPGMVVANAIGAGAELAGDVTSKIIDMGTERRMKKNYQLLGQTAFQQGMEGVQNQNSAFMEDGGWVSHDWQPQVITQFGGYNLKDLLKPDPTMNTLRTGGSIRDNYMGYDEDMSMMQMGGELQTHWGGDAEPISYNPYLPDGGETVMFRGQSHGEADGKGRTGIGITFGNNPVEVERGEPAVKLQDGGSDESLVVFGDMKIPSYGVSEIGDDKAKGMKFKHYGKHLSKLENKQNNIINRSLKLIDNVDSDSPFDLLKLNSGKMSLVGADMKLKDLAMKKQTLANVQNAILDTAEEYGLESAELAKGKIKQAKFGGNFSQAQTGINLPEVVVKGKKPRKPILPDFSINRNKISYDIPEIKIPDNYLPNVTLNKDIVNLGKRKSLLERGTDLYDSLYPYIKPGITNPLDPSQLMPEIAALAMNQLDPVQAQLYQPMLEQMPSISFQDQLNEIQADANASKRLVGNNPAALAMIDAQATAAKNKVLAEQFRTNQMIQAESRSKNIGMLNDATLKNLSILDQQYQRQSGAKSATKAQALTALSSIADKIGKNKAETLEANVLSNMYPQYTFGPKGRIYNTGLANFNIPEGVGSDDLTNAQKEQVKKLYERIVTKSGTGEVKDIKEREKTTSRNGSIVNALKNF